MINEVNPTNVTEIPAGVKTAAIYCRVSTDDQEREGTSLDTQRAACLKYCEEHNYTVTQQFLETWSGLSLDRPKLDELRQLVRNGEIAGVVIYCLDRLSRKPVHGVILTEELEKHNATLEAVTEDIDTSEMGKLINYIKGYAASLEAEKIRERTMRGTRARVFDKKLPVTRREPFGYSWSGEKRLEPNGDHNTVRLILDTAIDGKSYDYIIADLKKRAILSPSGLPDWNKHTISSIIRNPVYAGRFYAFKTEVTAPKQRTNGSYGNSSVKRLPMEKWHYIPEIEIVNPPITWEQRALLLDQLKQRQKLASRNAKREYLLRGMILCETHRGKKGEPRRYHGQPHHGSWRYACPEGKCECQYIDGPFIERNTKHFLTSVFKIPKDHFYRYIFGENRVSTVKSIENDLATLQKEKERLLNKRARLEDDRYTGVIDTELYQRLSPEYQSRGNWLEEHQNELLSQLENLKQQGEVVKRWEDLRDKFIQRLVKDEEEPIPINQWKELLNSIGFKWRVLEKPISSNIEYRVAQEWKRRGGFKQEAKVLERSRLEFDLRLINPEICNTIALDSPVPG